MALELDPLVALLVRAYPREHESELRGRLDRLIVEACAQPDMDEAELEEQVSAWVTQFPRRREDWTSVDLALADLRRVLLPSPQTRRARILRRLGRLAEIAAEHYIAAAGLVAALASAFYGLAYARFYESMGITPEQAGFTPAQVVAHSIVGGLVLLILITAAIFLFFVPLIPAREEKMEAGARRHWGPVAWNLTFTLAAAAGLAALCALAGRRWELIMYLLVIQLVWWALTSLVISERRLKPALLEISVDRYVVTGIACLIPAVLATGVVTYLKAESLGERATVGRAVRNPKIGVFPFLGVHAEPAEVAWVADPKLRTLPRCVLYLGSSEGDAVLYDSHSSSTFHVPTGNIAIDLEGDRSSCEAPVNVRSPEIVPDGAGKVICRHGDWRPSEHARYEYEWIWVDHELVDNGDGRPWLLYEWAFPPNAVVYCRVTAHTAIGEDTALATPVAVNVEPAISESVPVGGDRH
ncbi:MAG TPA: hypothetical protein VMT37_13135 [Solirubrobacterales bacterium]|nr:hypothetical protein [Solirubrobacterales bacterium]